ncbi:MAG: ABC transporter ATP-binding protein [Eubacteriaceae bacterium]|nr:ABC transporter ATP-binding protein [Eubacteriaceae bacterium]
MKPLVELVDIKKTYQTKYEETEAIKGFSLNIVRGDFISIVGPSGCGKSTVLSIIAGLTEPSGGSVKFLNDSITIGYMPQKDELFSWRSIYKNAVLGLEIQHKLTPEHLIYVEYLMKAYGLQEFKNAYPSQLSGGMRQRAALIRTLALKPDILLLDEPFSALDYQTRLTVSDDIRSIIAREEKTAVLVTHDLSEAISLSDKVAVMSARPSVLKRIYDISLPKSASGHERRLMNDFAGYFDAIWKDIDKNE